MNLYSYYFYEGDEGVVIAHSWEEAKELVEKEYKEYYGERNFQIIEKMENYDKNNCLLYEVGALSQKPMLFCTREW